MGRLKALTFAKVVFKEFSEEDLATMYELMEKASNSSTDKLREI